MRKPWLYRRGGPCALPANQSTYEYLIETRQSLRSEWRQPALGSLTIYLHYALRSPPCLAPFCLANLCLLSIRYSYHIAKKCSANSYNLRIRRTFSQNNTPCCREGASPSPTVVTGLCAYFAAAPYSVIAPAAYTEVGTAPLPPPSSASCTCSSALEQEEPCHAMPRPFR